VANDYGTSAALKAYLTCFEQSSRRSGRTMAMLRAVGSGDRIVTSTEQEARRLKALLRDMGKENVEVRALDPRSHPMDRLGTNAYGATVFDHNWVEGYWKHRIENAASDLTGIEEALSKNFPPVKVEWPDCFQRAE